LYYITSEKNYPAFRPEIGFGLYRVQVSFGRNIFFEKMGKEPIHKEYVQEHVTVENLLNEYKNLDREKFLENSKILREYLQYGSSKNVAAFINS